MRTLASWPPKTRLHLSRMGTPEGLGYSATPPDGPTYHLVHGDVLAMVIQPDGHLRRESELPGGKRVGPLTTELAPRGPPRAPPTAVPEVDGLLLRALPTTCGLLHVVRGLYSLRRLYTLRRPFLGVAGLGSGLRVS